MSRIEPITFRPFTSEYEILPPLEPTAKKNEEKEHPEYVSAYYMTTMSSLQSSVDATESSPAIDTDVKLAKEKPTSKIKQWGQWLIGLVWGSKDKNSEKTKVDQVTNSLGGSPKLEPQEIDQKKLAQAINELNRDLVHRLKDTQDFEDEMRKGTVNSKKMDKLIFVHLFDMSMKQKISKEDTSIDRLNDVMKKHEENKKIQKDYFTIWEDIKAKAQKSSFLGWINMGATVGIAGLFALTFATSGFSTLVIICLPLLSITQGITKSAEGVLKYQNDLKSGKLFLLKEQTSENSTTINESMRIMKTCDEETAELLKTIRKHLENQSKAERIFHAKL